MAIQSVTVSPVSGGQTAAPVQSRPQPAQSPPAPVTESPNRTRVARAIDSINQRLAESGNDLRFSMDEDSGKLIVRVVDTQTKQVIRQIPSEESVAISQSIERMQGLLVKQKA